MTQDEPIYVTKTFLPPREAYDKYLDRIWESSHLTNQGPLLREFEEKAANYLQIDPRSLQLVANGTLALQVSLKALGIESGEIITTPFSYVATTSSILWERCQPVFVDIKPDSLCIDADKIEAVISPRTKAIMGVHVFGNPCDVDKIDAIAKKYHLKVIYDGAHAFGAIYKGKSLLDYGDISTCSFHSTKLFHTIEGGAIITRSQAIGEAVDLIKRFGHQGDNHYRLGINAKASEFQAAMGLANMFYIDQIIQSRGKSVEIYQSALRKPSRVLVASSENFIPNYAYYPYLYDSESDLLSSFERMNKSNVFPRRYFYPSLNKLPYVSKSQPCPVSEDVSRRIACLPLYADMKKEDTLRVCELV